MESNMDSFINNIEAEHNSLTDEVTGLKDKVVRLTYEKEEIQKAFEKQKVFHRKYADEVDSMEKIRIQDFKEEKRSSSEQVKTLLKSNRQLNTDAVFYQQAYEEVTKELERVLEQLNRRTENTQNNLSLSLSPTPEPVTAKRVSRRIEKSSVTATSESQTISYLTPACDCTHTRRTKVDDKYFEENKKLKSKISTLQTSIEMLKKKNQQLEKFQNKIDKKNVKFNEDSAELEQLIESTKKKNKYTFNAEALDMLGKLVHEN